MDSLKRRLTGLAQPKDEDIQRLKESLSEKETQISSLKGLVVETQHERESDKASAQLAVLKSEQQLADKVYSGDLEIERLRYENAKLRRQMQSDAVRFEAKNSDCRYYFSLMEQHEQRYQKEISDLEAARTADRDRIALLEAEVTKYLHRISLLEAERNEV